MIHRKGAENAEEYSCREAIALTQKLNFFEIYKCARCN